MVRKKYDVIAEAEKIALQAVKPTWCSRRDWNKLPSEARILYFNCEDLPDQLIQRFREEVEQQHWREALLLYMAANQKPWLPYNSLDPGTLKHTWNQDKIRLYITEAEEWLENSKGLLDSMSDTLNY